MVFFTSIAGTMFFVGTIASIAWVVANLAIDLRKEKEVKDGTN